jgi:hypothetical protein
MRTIAVLAVLSAFALGGCFFHDPKIDPPADPPGKPIVLPPLK